MRFALCARSARIVMSALVNWLITIKSYPTEGWFHNPYDGLCEYTEDVYSKCSYENCPLDKELMDGE